MKYNVKALSIIQVIQDETGIVPDEKTRDCPICGHKKCFKLYPSNTYNCWAASGCNGGGSPIDVVMSVHNMSSDDAIKYLIEQYFDETKPERVLIPRPVINNKPEPKKFILDIELNNYFLLYLSKQPEDKTSIEYLDSRGLFKEVREKYNIQNIGNYYKTNNHLHKHFGVNRLEKAGYLSDKGNLLFFNRIIIPYMSGNDVIFMQGRAINPNETVKYLNLKCDKMPFNLNNISNATTDTIYIVEGAFDAISANELGYDAVALGSWSLPEKQLKKLLHIIKKNNKKCIFFMDDEKATIALNKTKISGMNISDYCDSIGVFFKMQYLDSESKQDFNNLLINDLCEVDNTMIEHISSQLKRGTYKTKSFRNHSPAQIKQVCKTLINRNKDITFNNDFNAFISL